MVFNQSRKDITWRSVLTPRYDNSITTSALTDHRSLELDLRLGLSPDDREVALRLQFARLADVVALVRQFGGVDDQLVLTTAQVLNLNAGKVHNN